MPKTLVFYVQDGFADWEAAYVLPLLRERGVGVRVVSENGASVTSAGGLGVVAQTRLRNVYPADIDGLILPGGDFWMDDTTNQPVLAFAQDLLTQGKMVAAICSATVALGRQGLLDQRRHTSNDLGVLKQEAPGYRGEALYVQSLAVTDGNLITASSIGALEFAREIADYLKLGSESYRKQWYELFKHGVAPPADFWTQS
ncbi:glutamine amidotransferase [Cystobacter fuscus]|uniref:DJ-1/PfpI family protein n=1 Tax=Cystobacter fuscus TaxID=43 RepID=UPI002B2B027D|nr:glutamine amidotransferase [Cystobacter fuscus]